MEKFAEVLKIFIEKQLLPSVISLAGAITTILFIPDDSWMLLKLGNILFGILVFCVYFLCIQIWLSIVHAIKRAWENASENNYRTNQRKKENQEAIMRIHEFVDGLTSEDKKLLVTFVKNGNKILIALDRASYDYSLLNDTNIMNVSEYSGRIHNIDSQHYWMAAEVEDIFNRGGRPVSGLRQYKLKSEVFHDFELVYKTEGKLGNF